METLHPPLIEEDEEGAGSSIPPRANLAGKWREYQSHRPDSAASVVSEASTRVASPSNSRPTSAFPRTTSLRHRSASRPQSAWSSSTSLSSASVHEDNARPSTASSRITVSPNRERPILRPSTAAPRQSSAPHGSRGDTCDVVHSPFGTRPTSVVAQLSSDGRTASQERRPASAAASSTRPVAFSFDTLRPMNTAVAENASTTRFDGRIASQPEERRPASAAAFSSSLRPVSSSVRTLRPASIWVAPFENQRTSAFDTEADDDVNKLEIEREPSAEPAKHLAQPDPARLEGPYVDGRFEQLTDSLQAKGKSLGAKDRQFCSELVHLEVKVQNATHSLANQPTLFALREELDEMVARMEERKALFHQNFHKTCILDRLEQDFIAIKAKTREIERQDRQQKDLKQNQQKLWQMKGKHADLLHMLSSFDAESKKLKEDELSQPPGPGSFTLRGVNGIRSTIRRATSNPQLGKIEGAEEKAQQKASHRPGFFRDRLAKHSTYKHGWILKRELNSVTERYDWRRRWISLSRTNFRITRCKPCGDMPARPGSALISRTVHETEEDHALWTIVDVSEVDDTLMQISVKSGATVVLRASTKEERDEWVLCIRFAREDFVKERG